MGVGGEPVGGVVNGFEDCVEPVEGGLQVEVIPQAVAEDEGVGFGGFAWGKEGAETEELFRGNGEADHLLDCVR